MVEQQEASGSSVPEVRKGFLEGLVAQGKRADGRGIEEPRELLVEKGFIKVAEGSARVKLGKTMVVVGVKMELGKPYPDSPDKGVISTGSELLPMASPGFDAGAPSPMSIELARVVDRGIRESDCLDLKQLVVEKGEKVWTVYIDVHVLDFDGNLIDAAGLAAIAALKCTSVPAERFGLGKDFPLPVKGVPVPVTMIKVGGALVVDPCLDEERIAEARITITTDDDGDVRAMQKGLPGAFTKEEVKKAVGISQQVGKGFRSSL